MVDFPVFPSFERTESLLPHFAYPSSERERLQYSLFAGTLSSLKDCTAQSLRPSGPAPFTQGSPWVYGIRLRSIQRNRQIPICQTATERHRAAQGRSDYTDLAHDLAARPAGKFHFLCQKRKGWGREIFRTKKSCAQASAHSRRRFYTRMKPAMITSRIMRV